MTRLLLMAAAAFWLSHLLEKQVRRLRSQPLSRAAKSTSPSVRQGGELVPCAHCQVHVAESRAHLSARDPSRKFCSEACRKLASAG